MDVDLFRPREQPIQHVFLDAGQIGDDKERSPKISSGYFLKHLLIFSLQIGWCRVDFPDELRRALRPRRRTKYSTNLASTTPLFRPCFGKDLAFSGIR